MSDNKMKPEIKALWTAALRSGEYTQQKEMLRGRNGMCCLGVLCDVYQKQGMPGEWLNGSFRADGEEMQTIPPSAVARWAGLPSSNPDAGGYSLAHRNDHGASFAEIADLIDKHL